MSDDLYDYGAPTTVGEGPEDVGVPQDNSEAVEVDEPGESPMEPPPDAETILEPGGSPSEESGMTPESPEEPEPVPVEPEPLPPEERDVS